MQSILTHIGWVFYARKTEEDGNEFSGTTPEVAIRKLWNKYPELNESEVIYQMPKRSGDKAIAIYDLNHCPVCKKPVVFIKATKTNGRYGVTIIHSDDDMPADAEWNIMVVRDYKKELLRKLHKIDETTQHQKLQQSEVEPKIVVSPKPKVVMSRPTTYASDVLANRPAVEIGGLKHNRFAIIGRIVTKLKEDIPEMQVSSIRSDLINHGKDLNALVNVANRYAIIHENGLPFQMESGL